MSSNDIPLNHGGAITGRVRVDEQARRLATRLEAGDIAVIDQLDIDRPTAQALISASPAAILNASPSETGRHKVLGPQLILDAQIPLFDDLGDDIMTLREGEEIRIEDGVIRRGDDIIMRDIRQVQISSSQESADTRTIGTQVASFAASIDDFLKVEGATILEGRGIPGISSPFDGHVVLLVVDDENARPQLKALKNWINDTDPVVIGVDSGADIARSMRLKPSIIVGNMDLVSEKALRSGAQLIVRQSRDGTAPGKERLDRMGVDYSVLEMTGTSEDTATVLATHRGAQAIVTVGAHHGLDDFVDQGRGAMGPSFFTRLRAGDLLVSADAVAATHRPRVRVGILIALLLTLVLAIAVALWSTPWGQDLLAPIITAIGGLFDFSSPSAGGVLDVGGFLG